MATNQARFVASRAGERGDSSAPEPSGGKLGLKRKPLMLPVVVWQGSGRAKCPCQSVTSGSADEVPVQDDGVVSSRSEQLQTDLPSARLSRGLSQGQLAEAVGVSRQTISSIETGQYCPSTVLALRLARTLNTTVEALFWLEAHTDAHAARS